MDDYDAWGRTKTVLRVGCQLVGALAIVCILIREGHYVISSGFSAWPDRGMAGADFILILAVAPVVLLLGLAVLMDGVNVVLDDRNGFYDEAAASAPSARRLHWARSRARRLSSLQAEVWCLAGFVAIVALGMSGLVDGRGWVVAATVLLIAAVLAAGS